MSNGEPYRAPPDEPQPSTTGQDQRIITSIERQKLVVEARRRGGSYSTIARETGLSKSQCHKLFKAWEESEPRQGVAEYRTLEREKLDARERRANRILGECEKTLKDVSKLGLRATLVRMMTTQQQELQAIATHRAKLDGTFAPTKHQVMGGDDNAVALVVVTKDQVLAKLSRIAGEPEPALPEGGNVVEEPPADPKADESPTPEGDDASLDDLPDALAEEDHDEDEEGDEEP